MATVKMLAWPALVGFLRDMSSGWDYVPVSLLWVAD